MRIAELVVDVRIRQLEKALRHLAGDGCEHYTDYPHHPGKLAPHGACAEQGRQPFAKYGADKWCNACIAKAALDGTLPNELVDLDGQVEPGVKRLPFD